MSVNGIVEDLNEGSTVGRALTLGKTSMLELLPIVSGKADGCIHCSFVEAILKKCEIYHPGT
jgi:hypothetical protein